MDKESLVVLLACGAAVVIAAAAGSYSAIDAADQYGELEQPSWAPPSWLFGPVWSVLYIAIALTGWQIWLGGKWSQDMKLWAGQLVVNALWTPLFFMWELRAVALVWILLLDGLVLWLIIRNWRLGWPAWVMIPYLAWTSFATLLNGAVWWLNRG